MAYVSYGSGGYRDTNTGDIYDSSGNATGTQDLLYRSQTPKNIFSTPSGAKVDATTGQMISGPTGSITSSALASSGEPIKLPNIAQTNPLDLQRAVSNTTPPSDILNRINTQSQTEIDQSGIRSDLMSALRGLSESGAYINNDGSIVAPQFRAQKENELGATNLRTDIAELTGQIDTLKNEANLIPDVLQSEFTGTGATSGGVEPIQTARLRTNYIQTMRLAAAASAKMGLLADANQRVENAIQAEFAPRIARLNYLKQVYDLNKDTLEREDKKRADEMNYRIAKEERDIKAAQEERTNIQNIGISAAENKADNPTISKIFSAKTTEDAIAIARPFLAPPDKPNLQIVDLGKDSEGNDLGKVLIDMNKRGEIVKSFGGAPVGGNAAVLKGQYGGVISAAAGLVGAERGRTTKAAISRAIADNDYATTWALIANNVEESLTGEVKSRFANQRNDYVALQGLRQAINNYAAAGGNMGLLVGTEEEIKRKLGIDSGKASALAVQLWREFQVYRNVLTGAAFSAQESADYASVNPTLKKSLKLNLNVIDGSLAQLENRIVSTVNTRVPGASDVFNNINGQVQSGSDGLSDDAAYQAYLKSTQSK